MGSIESDIAVIKNDIAHIKAGIEEIKNNCQERDNDCECKFNELYTSRNEQSMKIKEIDGQISFHNKVLAGLGTLFLALIAVAGDVVTWIRGG
ncbi:MAG: hypothetical protein JXQ82_07725 [Methanomicrobiaceae archaeon]|nr:hypothetical protein [Methanomicrobiaceae archaeon]